MAKKETTKPKTERQYEEFEVLENKLDFGFTQNYASFRSLDAATEARLKKMVERMKAKMEKK